MTREEAIIEAGIEYSIQNSPYCIGGDNFYEKARELNRNKSFEAGVIWADKNPKSPWISVKDDLPCNHEDLMVKDEKGRWETKRVLVRIQETDTSFKRPYFADCMMSKWDGEESGFLWHLCSQGYITHWMPIPELPK